MSNKYSKIFIDKKNTSNVRKTLIDAKEKNKKVRQSKNLKKLDIHINEEYNEEIEFKQNPYLLYTYEIEDKRKDLTVEGKIEMSNYSVPFDFKDNIFLFLEHHPKDKRAICTYEFK